MNDAERIEINNIAVSIMEDSLYPKELFEVAKRIYDLTKDPRPDWTPCAEGLPEIGKDVDVTVRMDESKKLVVSRGKYLGNKRWKSEDGSAPDYAQGTVLAWQPRPEPYTTDHIRDTTKMMLAEPVVHDEKAPPAKWCCGKPPIARYHESEIGLSRACHTIKCQVCHSGVRVDIENDTDEAYDAAFKHAVELWNEKVQHRPPMNTEICLPRTEEAE